MSESRIYRQSNRIVFGGNFGLAELHRPLAALHQAVQDSGYQDIVLDFEHCTAAFPSAMLALCAQVMKLQKAHIDFSLRAPKDEKLRRLFQNTNWAYFLAPREYDESSFRGYTQVPATQFQKPEDQSKAVNRIVNAILGAIQDIERRDFAALEWTVNELTDIREKLTLPK